MLWEEEEEEESHCLLACFCSLVDNNSASSSDGSVARGKFSFSISQPSYLLTSYLCFEFETRFTHSDDWVQVPTYLPINDPCFVIV